MRTRLSYLLATIFFLVLYSCQANAGMKLSRAEIQLLQQTQITSVSARVVWQSYPREVHKNSKRDGHGNGTQARLVILKTERGEGIGLINKDDLPNIVYRGNFQAPGRKEPLAGKSVWDLLDHETMLVSKDYAPYEIAIYDLVGVLLQKPFYELFGKPASTSIICYSGMIYLEDLEEENREEGIARLLADCEQDYDLGYRHFKLKLGRGAKWMPHDEGLKRDIDITLAIHRRFPDVTILVDPNDSYSVEDCITYLDGVKEVDIYWLEEPFTEDIEKYRELCRWAKKNRKGMLIADGEFDPQGEVLEQMMKEGLLDVYCEDVNQFGYSTTEGQFAFTQWIERIPLLKKRGVQASPHAWGSKCKSVYAAMLGMALGNVPMVEGVTSTCDELDYGYTQQNGYFIPSGKPGFGITFK